MLRERGRVSSASREGALGGATRAFDPFGVHADIFVSLSFRFNSCTSRRCRGSAGGGGAPTRRRGRWVEDARTRTSRLYGFDPAAAVRRQRKSRLSSKRSPTSRRETAALKTGCCLLGVVTHRHGGGLHKRNMKLSAFSRSALAQQRCRGSCRPYCGAAALGKNPVCPYV